MTTNNSIKVKPDWLFGRFIIEKRKIETYYLIPAGVAVFKPALGPPVIA